MCSRSARRSKRASSRSTRLSAASVSRSRPRIIPRKNSGVNRKRSITCVPAKIWSGSRRRSRRPRKIIVPAKARRSREDASCGRRFALRSVETKLGLRQRIPPRHPRFAERNVYMGFRLILFVVALALLPDRIAAQSAPAFSKVVVFGDSLSDDGNIKHVVQDKFFISYPSLVFDYSDGRFTNSANTFPGSNTYAGTWHEQLAQTFLGLSAASCSLDGGTDYAFGGATTNSGSSERTVISKSRAV